MTIKKSCFVIMPFGEKKDYDGKMIDFDKIYEEFIKGVLEGRGQVVPGYAIECTRCDEIPGSGWIHRTMISHIYDADLAVVDLSTLNANVFYELGVRHSLVPSGTLLIRRDGTRLPFNISGFNTISYPTFGSKRTVIEDYQERLKQFAATAITVGGVDSLVHEAINVEVRVKSRPIAETKKIERMVDRTEGKRVGLITGDLVNIRDVDAWVNSENTSMEMDRYQGGSISSVVRYHGAEKDAADHVVNDVIAEELAAVMKDRIAVGPGSVLVTGSGELEKTNGVKRIFHAASVIGQVRVGFKPIPNLRVCVERVLERTNALTDVEIRSILFPLMGTGTARGALEIGARELIGAAVSYFRNNPRCKLEKVYFLTWTQAELRVCRQILQQDPRLKAVRRPAKKAKATRPRRKAKPRRAKE